MFGWSNVRRRYLHVNAGSSAALHDVVDIVAFMACVVARIWIAFSLFLCQRFLLHMRLLLNSLLRGYQSVKSVLRTVGLLEDCTF